MAFVTFNDPSSPSMFEVDFGSSGGGVTIQLPSTISIGGGGSSAQPLPTRTPTGAQTIPSGAQPGLTGGLTLLLLGLLVLLVLPK
jgi:hypothetical protein